MGKKISGTSGKPTKQYTHDELYAALLHLQDTMERCLLPFMLLDDTAEQVIHETPLDVPEISVGVQQKHLTRESKSTLKSLIPDLVDADVSLGYTHNGVPVTIWVIQRRYKFFQCPDIRFYNITHFFVPNPFQSYWKARFLIK